MVFKKYKYYFKKPRSEIVKDVLTWLAYAGAISIAATSPYFLVNFLKSYRRWKKYPKKRIQSTFYNLKKAGLIQIEKRGRQIYIHLTKEGRKKAGMFQIDNLRIQKPKKWDKEWRLVIFDISELKKTQREAFRGKLKDLGFSLLQRSVWIQPFDCRAEIELLREFFGLSENEIRLVVAKNIGVDKKLKEFFRLN
jgi:DNA-binding transcriptional regulator PaaX